MPTGTAVAVKYRVDTFQKYARQFEQANPGTKITIETLPKNNYNDSLTKRLQDEKPVDLVFGDFYAPLVQDGAFADLLPFYKADRMLTDDLYKSLVDMVTVKGKMTGVPLSPQPLALFYNKEWFNKAALPYPNESMTWQQYYDYSERLKSVNELKGKNVFGSVTPFDLQFFESLAMSSGLDIMSPDDSHLQGYVDKEQIADTFMSVLDPINNRLNSKRVNNSITPPYTDLNANTVGMGIGQASIYYSLVKSKGAFGVSSLPMTNQGGRANSVYFSTLSITAKSKQQKLAWAFMKDVFLNGNSAFHDDWSRQELLTSKAAIHRLVPSMDDSVKVLYAQLNNAVEPLIYRNPGLQKIVNTDMLKKLGSYTSKEAMQRGLSEAAYQIDTQLGAAK
jgi:ABC-type glycerol-3-phosphate transport system substrate-binding protein